MSIELNNHAIGESLFGLNSALKEHFDEIAKESQVVDDCLESLDSRIENLETRVRDCLTADDMPDMPDVEDIVTEEKLGFFLEDYVLAEDMPDMDEYVKEEDLPDYDDLESRIDDLEYKCDYDLVQESDLDDKIGEFLDEAGVAYQCWVDERIGEYIGQLNNNALESYVTRDCLKDTIREIGRRINENNGKICELEASNDYLRKQLAYLATQNMEMEKRIARVEAPIRIIEKLLKKSGSGIEKLLKKIEVKK